MRSRLIRDLIARFGGRLCGRLEARLSGGRSARREAPVPGPSSLTLPAYIPESVGFLSVHRRHARVPEACIRVGGMSQHALIHLIRSNGLYAQSASLLVNTLLPMS